jgi:Ni,Fe-hydrogenase I large subunit
LLQNPDDTNPYSQLIRLQADKKALEKRLVTQKAHVEQAQQALKREIARRVHAEQTQQALKKEIAQLLDQLKQVRQE